MKLTKEQIREVYNAIISQDADFVRVFAEVALEESLETKASMWVDAIRDTPGLQVPDISDGKDMAKDFVADMLKDFNEAHRASVDRINARSVVELNVTVRYGAE